MEINKLEKGIGIPIIIIAVAFILVIAGFIFLGKPQVSEEREITTKEIEVESNTTQDDSSEIVVKEEEAKIIMGYSGTVLAGESSPILDFNKSDYDTALKSDKLIVLYFYASWCPICRAEVPHLYSAFDELKEENVVGFRVNYNDSQTDNNEENLAREFSVLYQHTKVFLKNGQRVLKSPETWNKDRYLSEINKSL
ncbi:MAG: thioredoxin family protein [Patescibacteria group bacterium]|nr:thioredoxin family protein [Patescibacteria group bacterium]